MAIVKPFSALRYDQALAGGPLERLVCPPYDVIDPAMQEALHRQSPCNVVHVELSKASPDDVPGNDRYSRAAQTLRDWIARGVLKSDPQPAFYVYEQTFDIASGGASRSRVVARRGFFGAIRLEPFGTGCVYPHEETFGAPKADRLELMRACAANVSPVFGLVPDEANAVAALLRAATGQRGQTANFQTAGNWCQSPLSQATETNGVVNRLWAMSDPDWCGKLAGLLRGLNIYIADGHHRYETFCNYRDERRKADGDPQGQRDLVYNYGLMVCVPMSDEGLYILPTHRLIQAAPGLSKEGFLRDAAALFDQRDAADKDLCALAEEQSGAVKFGVVFSDGSMKIITAKPQSAAAMQQAAPAKSAAWRGLDVAVLQELVLKGMLRLSAEKVLRKEGLSYTPDTRQAIARVTAPGGQYVMGFILRPTLIEQVRAVATAGEKMPQKSTYFFPKLLTGLVIREL